MMMECPRCGFVQPKDQYCASCGLDIDHYTAKPKPLLVRLVQNPNMHLSLIGVLVVLIIGYIFYSQRALVSRQVGALFSGTPLASRDAGDGAASDPKVHALAKPAKREEVAEVVAETADTPTEPLKDTAATAPVEVTKVEISYWEVPREILTGLITSAEKLGESNAGRAYFWSQGAKAADAIIAGGHRISLSRTMPIENGAQIQIETPPTTPESFQFGLYFQVSKLEGKDLGLKWESTMVLPPPETPAEAAGSRQPVMKALTETQLSGSASPTPTSALLIVYEPTTRTIRDESLAKAGDGPWTVFGSYDFRSGATDWVVLVQLK
ncbi:MAG: hypothetical protein ACXVA9_09465 [Bdellovibrionales bacterium]